MSFSQIVFALALTVFGAGVYVVAVEKRRMTGGIMIAASVAIIAVCGPSLLREFSEGKGALVSTGGGGTGGSNASGGGGGVGAPGGNGGTIINNNFGVLKTVALARVCTQEMLPLSIPPNTPNTPTYILQIHPKIAGSPNGWIPLTMVNTSGKVESWPPPAVAKGNPCCFSAYRCEFQNLGDVPFLSVNVEFLAQFPKVEPKGFNGTPPIEFQAKSFIVTETLDARQKFTVYLVNASHRWVYCWYPIFATVQLLGENTPRKISINSSTATFLDEVQFATLAPTQLKWQGLP